MGTLQDAARQSSGTRLDGPSCRERLQACRHSQQCSSSGTVPDAPVPISQVAWHT